MRGESLQDRCTAPVAQYGARAAFACPRAPLFGMHRKYDSPLNLERRESSHSKSLSDVSPVRGTPAWNRAPGPRGPGSKSALKMTPDSCRSVHFSRALALSRDSPMHFPTPTNAFLVFKKCTSSDVKKESVPHLNTLSPRSTCALGLKEARISRD